MLPPSNTCKSVAVCSASVVVNVMRSSVMDCMIGVVNCCTSTSKVVVLTSCVSGSVVSPTHSQLPPQSSPTSISVSSGKGSPSGAYQSHAPETRMSDCA